MIKAAIPAGFLSVFALTGCAQTSTSIFTESDEKAEAPPARCVGWFSPWAVQKALGVGDTDNIQVGATNTSCKPQAQEEPEADEIAPDYRRRNVARRTLKRHRDELEGLGIEHLALYGPVASGEAAVDDPILLIAIFDESRNISRRDITEIEKHITELLESTAVLTNRKDVDEAFMESIKPTINGVY